MGRIVGLVVPEAPTPKNELGTTGVAEDLKSEAPTPEKRAGRKKKGEED
ncbi:MAG: hypothetical protein PUK21_01505 [Peptostreptococcaceae bacterium]|nr:hypothetical protein [Peptostreptococcaceae bacterium]MDY5738685.1 hypothetical protein [Anaerovoracaceae bacterium]